MQLKPRELSVMCCLMYHANSNRLCFPSRRLIAKECNLSLKTVDAALKELINRGIIRKVANKRSNGSRTSNIYEIYDFFYGNDFVLPD